jgi:hypothetical protein
MRDCEVEDAVMDHILLQGSLSTRILKALHSSEDKKDIEKVFMQLAECLNENKLFSA